MYKIFSLKKTSKHVVLVPISVNAMGKRNNAQEVETTVHNERFISWCATNLI